MAEQRGWAYSVPHFRGCSGELNLAPRAYHSGDFEEIGWMLQELRVSLFAQALGTRGKVSEKRITQALAEALVE